MDTSRQQKSPDDAQSDCAAWCFSECLSENIGLEHDHPPDFVTSQWPISQSVYSIYRVVVGVVLLTWVAGDVWYEAEAFYAGEAYRWLFFASNWSFAIVAFTASLQAVTAGLYRVKPYWVMDPVYLRSMPVILKLQWVLYNISCNSALVVTVAYWGFIAFVAEARNSGKSFHFARHKEESYVDIRPLLTSDMSRLKHTLNSVYVISDVMLSATPIRLFHLFFTVFMASLYIVFNALYYVNNGSLIIRTGIVLDDRDYYFMNWSQPVEAICTCVLGMFLCCVSQLVLHGLCVLRWWLVNRQRLRRPLADSEMQNIVTSSSSYNSIEDAYGP